MRYQLAVAVSYLAVLNVFAHGSRGSVPDWIAFSVIFALPFAIGYIVGLWSLLVPPLAVLMALPLGYGTVFPIWFVMLFVAFIATPEIVIGWGARWLVRRCVRRSQTAATRWTG